MIIFIVVLEDRHIDPVITVHATRESADAKVEEHRDRYRERYEWTVADENPPRGRWLRYCRTDSDDGPKIHIEQATLEGGV